MKVNKSFFNKIMGKNLVEPEPGDIIYFNKDKAYWIYLGEPEEVLDPTDSTSKDDISKDGKVHIYHGLSAIEYIKKLRFNAEQMYKVNDDIIFHFKFVYNRTIEQINRDYQANEARYVMTLNEEEFKKFYSIYTLYTIKESNK